MEIQVQALVKGDMSLASCEIKREKGMVELNKSWMLTILNAQIMLLLMKKNVQKCFFFFLNDVCASCYLHEGLKGSPPIPFYLFFKMVS